MSVELKIHSLLGQWFRRVGVSPGAWVSLLTFWCFDRFGVSPMLVLSQPSGNDITTLPTFFYHCFLAWIALAGSLSGGELVVGSSLAGGPLLVSTMTSKTCYDLLLSRNPALPHCVGKLLPLFGAWEWSSTWTWKCLRRGRPVLWPKVGLHGSRLYFPVLAQLVHLCLYVTSVLAFLPTNSGLSRGSLPTWLMFVHTLYGYNATISVFILFLPVPLS